MRAQTPILITVTKDRRTAHDMTSPGSSGVHHSSEPSTQSCNTSPTPSYPTSLYQSSSSTPTSTPPSTTPPLTDSSPTPSPAILRPTVIEHPAPDPNTIQTEPLLPTNQQGRATNPYQTNTSFGRFLNTINHSRHPASERANSTLDLEHIVENAFHKRSLPPPHIQRRLATVQQIPPEEFPIYTTPPVDYQPAQPPATPNLHPTTPNLQWGDSIQLPKEKNQTRIYFQNVFGLRLTTDGTNKWADCLRHMQDYQCDIFGFAETNCNWSHNRVRQKVNRTGSQLLPRFQASTSHNSYPHESDYLPGGTMTASHGSWSGRITTNLNDPHRMGRWSGSTYSVHSGHKLVVLTAYRVCKQDAQEGVYSSYKQQQLGLRKRFGPTTTPCPRRAFITDLIAYVQELQLSPDDFLLLMMDSNEVLGEDTFGILNLVEQLQLVDLFERHHQQSCDIATYTRSNDRRIDYMLGTPNLLPFIHKCGYLPFQKGIDSDHRASFLELNQSFIDGRARMYTPPQRLIGYNTNKSEVFKYKTYLTEQFNSKEIFNRAQTLFDAAALNMQNEDQFLTELNVLDQEVTDIMLAAERTQCTKKPPFAWSPTVHQSSLIIKYWQLKQASVRHDRDRTVQLEEIFEQISEANQSIITNTTDANPSTQLHRAKIDKQRLHLTQRNKRATIKRKRMETDAIFYDIDPEQALKRIGMKDESAHLFRYLDKVYKKQKGRSISHIEIPFRNAAGELTSDPLDAEEWIKVTDPAEFVPMLLSRNISHFGQAKHSPFATTPLADVFGYTGTNASATSLIDHGIIPLTCTTDDVHQGAQAILRKLADKCNSAASVFNVDFTEFWSAFSKWDERTSTSPSQRHLGHYKALQMSDGNDKAYLRKNRSISSMEEEDLFGEDGAPKIPNPSDAIQLVYYQIAMAAVRSGNTLRRWCKSSSLMLEKTPGSPKIHKLRVIHIYEADYNLMLKVLWARQLVWKSHSEKKLHRGQAGSRPDHRCSDVVVRKEMNYLYARLTRTALATVDNDAKACYDRILCNLAMLVSRYYGMSHEACLFHSKTLQAQQYQIRTAASGDSEHHYKHTVQTPIHGSGQGSCASPALWLMISSILMHVFDKTSHGMVLTDVSQGNTKTTSAEGFVDDVALFTNLHALTASDLPTLHRALSEDINTWQNTLAGSGGKLELIKCFYYILMWRFNKMGDPIPLTKTELVAAGHHDITIQDPDTQQTVTLEHKCIAEVHRTLGAYKTISGDETEQFRILLAKSNRLAISTAQGQLTRAQARRAYSSIYIPSIRYSLVTTNLNLKLASIIQTKAMLAFLPAMGFERTFPRAVVFGPRCYGGLNLSRLYTETCVAKISTVISHLRANTGLGQSILVNINWLQLHAGSFHPIMTSTKPLPYLKQNWLLHMREYLWSINGTISVPAQWLPTPQRKNDVALMDRFYELSVGTDVLRIVNNWRLFFQVITLSDIVSADGTHIQQRYWKQGRHNLSLTSEQTTKLNWPVQTRPDSNQYGKWISCITAAFSIDNHAGTLPNQHQLGDWLCTSTTASNQWKTYFDITTQSLYREDAQQWQVHPIQENSVRRPTAHTWTFLSTHTTVTPSLPTNAFPVSTMHRHTNILVQHRKQTGPTTITRTPPSTFEDHILQMPPWRGDLLMHWSSAAITKIQAMLEYNNTIAMASDGAYNEETKTGAYGVVIGSNDEELLTTQGTAPGAVHLHSSFRSELYGLLAGCILLNEVVSYYDIKITTDSTLTIYIDNKGVVDRVNRHRRQAVALCEMLDTDIDIELQVLQEMSLLHSSGFSIIPIQHVKAHQDEKTPYDLLSRPAQLNVTADRLAAQVTSDNLIPISYSVPAAVPAMLYINNIPITSKVHQNLCDAYNSQDLRKYMQDKYGWDGMTIDDIWWEGHDRALKRLSHADRHTIQKFNFHHLPTLRREKLKNDVIPDNCPHCRTNTTETDDHALLCTSSPRMQAKLQWERNVYEYLSQEYTPVAVKQAIMLAFHAWILMQPIPNIDTVLPHLAYNVRAAYHAQTSIGWDHFIRGRCSYLWRPILQQHFRSNNISGRKMNSIRWITGLILTCWNGVLAIWDVRNKEYHGHDDATQQEAARKRLLLEAVPLLSHAHTVHPNDQHWFNQTVATLSEYSVISLQAWIRNARTMVRIHHREQLQATPTNDDQELAMYDILTMDGAEENQIMTERDEEDIEERRRVVS